MRPDPANFVVAAEISELNCTSTARAVKRVRKSPTPPSVSESDGETGLSFSVGDNEPGPSSRKRNRKGPAPAPVDTAPTSPKLRYFAVPETDTGSRSKRRRKAFSPSAPAGAYEDDEDEEGEDSSAEEDGQNDNGNGNDERRAREAVEDGRARWSAVSTPLVRTPGPSSTRPSEFLGDSAVRSTFIPRRGVNVHTISEDELRAAGINDGSGAGVILSLGAGETLSIAGVFALVPIQGSISLLSTTARPSSTHTHHPVFAPLSHPVPVIRPVPTQTALRGTTAPLPDLPLPRSFALRDEETPRTIFLVREHRTGIEGMRGGAIPGFNNAWLEENGTWGLKGVHPVIGSFPVPVYPHITLDSWSTALDSLNRLTPSTANDDDDVAGVLDEGAPTIALIKGPKRSGKSTVARAALNRLLDAYETVAWLECDLGQGEFGCGGVVGLWVIDRPILGPPFTHPRLPQRAHYLGTYTPLTCPGDYLAAISHLLDHFRFEVQYPLSPTAGGDGAKRSDIVPLVINTQGWVKGLGEELLRSIESMACPTHVFDFESEPSPTADQAFYAPGWTRSPVQQYASLPFSVVEDRETGNGNGNTAGAVSYHLLEPAPISPLHTRYTPADMRVLSTLSYFYSRISPGMVSGSVSDPNPNTKTKAELSTWDYSSPLTEQSPWEVILGETIREVYVIGEGSDGVVSSDLPLALNGSVVALLERLTPSTVTQNSKGHEHAPSYVQARPPPPLDETTFLGLALIRAVSSNSPIKLHLLTPLPSDVLRRATIMVKNGAIELPAPGMMDWRDTRAGRAGRGGWEVPEEMPFFESGEAGVGGERRRFRRNIMRKGM
ncbi:Polynucleotide 5'-hydroxyl-kinase grc3 [Saitozyma podzolica]|uniref:Polynucleotide 5'-hydroxyl-kinase GRC3 n=1 Tax=Saitozyma podzolica TaxID=1890683 RepID=A0A427YIR5_9TREE|nr:Polynucleotide 5'-hydroxyl-kinase grc3 [Saitozyma podzolica]